MGKRLTSITTKRGDDGTTGLGDGNRVGKDHPRIEAIGAVDTLNTVIGQVLAEELPHALRETLTAVQHDLFDLGGELAVPGRVAMSDTHVAGIERQAAELNARLAPLQEFVLPGGTRAAATCHYARAKCREAERRVIALSREEPASPPTRAYLNRLSDLLFIVARTLNKEAGVPDTLWEPGRNVVDAPENG